MPHAHLPHEIHKSSLSTNCCERKEGRGEGEKKRKVLAPSILEGGKACRELHASQIWWAKLFRIGKTHMVNIFELKLFDTTGDSSVHFISPSMSHVP